ncbi:MAG: NAD(P)-dependent oxidoreductase [Acidimicrobiales bacterium]
MTQESPPPTILAHLGRLTDLFVPALQAIAPDARVVTASSPASASATGEPGKIDVVVTLGSESSGLASVLTSETWWIHVLGAGVDGFPIEDVGDRLVTCSRGASAPAIAEFVLATMLAFEKGLPNTWVDGPPKSWGSAKLGGLRGRTVGIVGLGSIGTEVARRALAFDMRVMAKRRSRGPSPVPGVEMAVSLEEMASQSDHLVIAAPATPQTRHLLNRNTFASIKKGAHLVNVARGSLIDQEALLWAIDEGIVAIASLDVVDPEPLPADHPFYIHPKIRLSPHVSWCAPDSGIRTLEIFGENLRRYRAGEPLQGIVDTSAGY